MAEKKTTRQSVGKITPVTTADLSDAKDLSRRLASLCAILSRAVAAVKHDGEFMVVGGRQLLPHLNAALKIGGEVASQISQRWPDAMFQGPPGIPESVPESDQNTRNGASESRDLSHPTETAKRKKTP